MGRGSGGLGGGSWVGIRGDPGPGSGMGRLAQEEDREGSQDARSSAHSPRRADTHPPVFSALPQPRRPLAPRAGQDEGLGMVGTHGQVGCSPPPDREPLLRPVPGGRLVATVSARPVCPSPCPVSGCPRDTGSKLHPCGCGSRPTCFCSQSFSPHLCSLRLSLSVACSVSPSPPQGLLPWTFPGQPSTKPHKRSTLVASEPRSQPHAWDQRRPGDGCGPGAGWVGASLWGLQEAESSWPLPCHPPSGLGETSAEVCISSVASPAPRGLPGAAFLSPPGTCGGTGSVLLETDVPRMDLNFPNPGGPLTCFSFLPEHALCTSGILDLLRSAWRWGQQRPQPGLWGC